MNHAVEIYTVDLKTGKGFSDWDESKLSVYDELKLHHYRYQLMMYKLLVENSRDYRDNTVTDGVLEFVEERGATKTSVGNNRRTQEEVADNSIATLSLSFDSTEAQNEVRRLRKLAVAVYKKIVALDFPDTSKYEETLDGIKEFEEDLIAGSI
jgi:hypothetical protein